MRQYAAVKRYNLRTVNRSRARFVLAGSGNLRIQATADTASLSLLQAPSCHCLCLPAVAKLAGRIRAQKQKCTTHPREFHPFFPFTQVSVWSAQGRQSKGGGTSLRAKHILHSLLHPLGLRIPHVTARRPRQRSRRR